ncbi:unnamed protein product, partial [Amoebophrya sp. A120]
PGPPRSEDEELYGQNKNDHVDVVASAPAVVFAHVEDDPQAPAVQNISLPPVQNAINDEQAATAQRPHGGPPPPPIIVGPSGQQPPMARPDNASHLPAEHHDRPSFFLENHYRRTTARSRTTTTRVSTSTFALEDGKTFDIYELLGRGGSAEVYRVRRDKKSYAMKIVKAQTYTQMENYAKEVVLLQNLTDQNRKTNYSEHVVRCFGSRCEPETLQLYILLEFADCDFKAFHEEFLPKLSSNASSTAKRRREILERRRKLFNNAGGGASSSVRDEIGKNDSNHQHFADEVDFMPLPTILHCFRQMAAAVEFIHSQNIVHFDLKPANFLLFENRTKIKVSDFGLARVLEQDKTHISRHGQCGTALFMAPEAFFQGDQYESSMKMKPGTDIWSLGIILYAMIYGKPPHAYLYANGGNQNRVMFCIVDPTMEIQYPDRYYLYGAEDVKEVYGSSSSTTGKDHNGALFFSPEDSAGQRTTTPAGGTSSSTFTFAGSAGRGNKSLWSHGGSTTFDDGGTTINYDSSSCTTTTAQV